MLPNGCWEWTGTRNKHGYGIVCLMLDGKPNTMPAPRLQWMRVKGRPQDGMDICHTCDNRGCISPEHLFEGTPLDNIRDMIAKNRAVHARGEGSGQTTLTEEQVSRIKGDGRILREIAKDYGVSPTTICNIRHGKTWAHVPKAA